LEQLIPRAFIAVSTIACGIAGYEKSHKQLDSQTAIYTLGATLTGFTASYFVVIYPLILKRMRMQTEVNNTCKEIESLLEQWNNPEHTQQIHQKFEGIDNVQKKKLSMTVGAKLRAITELLNEVKATVNPEQNKTI